MFLVDSHCHLKLLNYTNEHTSIVDVLDKAAHKKVRLVLSVSIILSDYNYLVERIGENRKDVVFSCGVHPIYVNFNENFYTYKKLYILSLKKNIVAIGETGLDYYHKLDNKEQQKRMFREHINIANEVNKPVIVHSRNASKDTIILLREEQAERCGGVLHCFNESIEIAKLLLNMNFYISFSGIITFSNSHILQEVIRYIPLDRILLETDSPYLTPVPYRGRENQPAYVYEVAKFVALVKNITMDKLAHCTTLNFFTLFRLKKDKYNLFDNYDYIS